MLIHTVYNHYNLKWLPNKNLNTQNLSMPNCQFLDQATLTGYFFTDFISWRNLTLPPIILRYSWLNIQGYIFSYVTSAFCHHVNLFQSFKSSKFELVNAFFIFSIDIHLYFSFVFSKKYLTSERSKRVSYYIDIKRVFYSFALLIRKILFSPLEDQIHIFAPPRNILYIYFRPHVIYPLYFFRGSHAL